MQKKALKNIPNSSSTTAISVLASRPVPPKKEEILLPNVRAFFVQGEKKQQLVALDLSSMQFPEGTKILFERQVP
ncbi:hypothetical protein H6768_00630 [Candidatus Peribacteria bacterium]|nr:hypothetical protein [Candidatus Peribacteria bacterium]